MTPGAPEPRRHSIPVKVLLISPICGLTMNGRFYLDPSSGKVLADRRSGIDRREPAILRVLFGRLRRRKKGGRRRTDRGGYVDIYDVRTWSVVIAILILSFMDALLTGLQVMRGSAHELNPILDAAISCGGIPALFGVKAAMTVLPMTIILVHKEWALGRYAARLCLWSYILVSVYHLYLVFGIEALGTDLRLPF